MSGADTSASSRKTTVSSRVDFLNMPFGKWHGCSISSIPKNAPDYAKWLMAQGWFKRRYPDQALALARAIKRTEEERNLPPPAPPDFLAELRAREAEQIRRYIEMHRLEYLPGIMPFGKYRDMSLAVVVRDARYLRYLFGQGSIELARAPGLREDLKRLEAELRDGDQRQNKTTVEAENVVGGCRIYRPLAWQALQARKGSGNIS